MFVNVDGVYHIQKWIDENQDKNPQVFDLWASGIASVINKSGCIEQELQDKADQCLLIFILNISKTERERAARRWITWLPLD